MMTIEQRAAMKLEGTLLKFTVTFHFKDMRADRIIQSDNKPRLSFDDKVREAIVELGYGDGTAFRWAELAGFDCEPNTPTATDKE